MTEKLLASARSPTDQAEIDAMWSGIVHKGNAEVRQSSRGRCQRVSALVFHREGLLHQPARKTQVQAAHGSTTRLRSRNSEVQRCNSLGPNAASPFVTYVR